MEDKKIKSKVITSLLWKLLERGGTQGIQLVVQIVLARLLVPEEFGTIALVMVFISISRVFVESGFNTALIQKKDTDEIDFSSVLYLSLVIAGIIYAVIYNTAPLIAKYYRDPVLIPVLRVLSITLFIGAFNSIQNAFIAKHMLFKKLFFSSFGAIIISGLAGIIAAYSGMGVWSLVIHQLVNQITVTFSLFVSVKWRPLFVFSLKRVRKLFAYGSKILISSLLETFYNEIRTLVIGRTYSPSMLGFYNRGEQFPKIIVTNINGSIQSVMLPTLSAYQDNKKRTKEIVRRSIVSSSFLIFPMMIGMAVVSEQLVKIVLTEKWLPSVPFLQVFCISYALMPIHTANLQAINAMGRSDIFLKLEMVKKICGIIILIISMPFGIYAIALGMVANGMLSSFINAYPNKRLLNYSYLEQIKDVIPSLIISILMGIFVYMFNFMKISEGYILIVQIFAGFIIYIFLAKVFKNESFTYLIQTAKDIYISRKNN